MIFVMPPDAEERASLFRIYLKNVPVAKDIDFDKLGVESDGFTGADRQRLQAGENKRARNHRKDGRRDPDIPRQRGIDTAQPRPSAPSLVVSGYLTFLARYGQR